MSTDPAAVRHEQRYPAAPPEVLAVLTDPAFLTAWAVELGARVDGVEASGLDGDRRTTLRLGVPTLGIPPVFARFVGGEVTVHDERSWRPDGRGGSTADLSVRARIFGRDAVVRGTSALTAVRDGGTAATTSGRVTVDAPVVGRQAEAAVAQLVAVVLRRQAELLRRRLPGGGPASSSA